MPPPPPPLPPPPSAAAAVDPKTIDPNRILVELEGVPHMFPDRFFKRNRLVRGQKAPK